MVDSVLHAAADCEILKVPLTTYLLPEAAIATIAHSPTRENRTIRLPLSQSEYDEFLTGRADAKVRLQDAYESHPEWFPERFDQAIGEMDSPLLIASCNNKINKNSYLNLNTEH